MSNAVLDALNSFFDSSSDPILFTGAGISVKAGLPTWKALIEKLADGIRHRDSITAEQMLVRVGKGSLTTAIDYFMLSDGMNSGDKFQLIADSLSSYDCNAILNVAKLPFKACLTTNFDESILQAIGRSREKYPRDYKYGDSSFKRAQWEKNLFVARIHGAVENPEAIVLSDRQFDSLLRDEAYLELLRTCFAHRNVLFLGFSFYDPAIRHVFAELEKKFGSATTGRHLAILPDNIESEFIQKAHNLNIDVVRYSAADHHKELWDALEQFNTKPITCVPPPQTSPFSFTKQFLATCYARSHAGSQRALREAVAEGVISALLQECLPQSIQKSALYEKMRLTLGVKADDVPHLVDTAVASLNDSRLCSLQPDGSIIWIDASEGDTPLDDALARLVESTVSRAFVSESWVVPDHVRSVIERFFDGVVSRRGWDLGAAFSAGRVPEAISVESLMNECAHDIFTYDRERLLRVCQALFDNPTVEEADILSELGRVSFAIEIAFKSPDTVLLNKTILPRRIFFDASVILPIIAEGHIYTKLYKDAISRLKQASSSAAVKLRLLVSQAYLNEIISHKIKAEAYYREAGIDFKRIAISDSLYSGSANTNVFIAGYVNWVANNNPEMSFPEYLDKYAPFNTEAKLKTFLTAQGFEIIPSSKDKIYADLYSIMERYYAQLIVYGKTPLLIEHDAIQVATLVAETQRGERSIFVTADQQLRQVLTGTKYEPATEFMISHVGLVQFIEIMLGGVREGIGLAKLLWSSKVSEKSNSVRSYLISSALEKYDAGLLMSIQSVVDDLSEQMKSELKRKGEDLDSEDPAKRVRAFRALGVLEAQYFDKMKAAMEQERARDAELS